MDVHLTSIVCDAILLAQKYWIWIHADDLAVFYYGKM